MSDHKFFNDFGYKKPQIIKEMPEEMQYNLFIMEIYNNWSFVKSLMLEYKEGKLTNKPIDSMSQCWLSNLIQSGIDLETFDSADDFYEKCVRDV